MTQTPPAPRQLPPRPERAAHRAWWPGLCLLIGVVSLLVWMGGGSAALAWHAATWPQEPWVLWTASLVHLSGAHLLVNLVALAVLAVLGTLVDAGRIAVLALVLAWPLATLLLLYWPQIGGYSGMSGLLNAMAAVLWVHTLFHAAKPVSFIIFAALAIKLLGEHAWSQPIAFDPNWGFNVVYAAHLAGALAGAACGLVLGAVALVRKNVSR